MAGNVPTFEEYFSTLGRLSAHIDPTASTPEAMAIKAAAESLRGVDPRESGLLAAWVEGHPDWVPVLGLAVGLRPCC